MAKFDNNDDGVVVVIGSGAGGGTLANELCQKGIKVVLLEAGKHYSIADFSNDEWNAFGQLSWLDKRTTSGTWRVAKDFSGLPAWICKTVGGSTTHWAGASLRLQEHEFRAQFRLRRHRGRDAPRLAAEPGGPGALVRQGRGQDGGHPDQRHPRPARQQQLQGHVERCHAPRLQERAHRTHGHQQPAPGRTRRLPAARVLLPGLQDGRQVVDPVHRDPESRGHRQPGPAPREPGAHHYPQ